MFSGYFGAGPAVTSTNTACLWTLQQTMVNGIFDELGFLQKSFVGGKEGLSKNLIGEPGSDRFGLLCDAINGGPEQLAQFARQIVKSTYNSDLSEKQLAAIRGLQSVLKKQLSTCAPFAESESQGGFGPATGEACVGENCADPVPPPAPAPAPAPEPEPSMTSSTLTLLALPLGLLAWWLWSRR